MEKGKQVDENEVAANINGVFRDRNGPNRGGGSSSNGDSLLPGYRFIPTDAELLMFYLKNKILGKEIRNDRIRDVNLYDYNPKQLFEMYKLDREEAWYFYTPRKKKSSNSSQPNRAAGNGFWKASTVLTPKHSNNRTVGYKRLLVYYEGKAKTRLVKTNWRMHEYTLDRPHKNTATTTRAAAAGEMKLDDWVLCKLYHQKRGSNFAYGCGVPEEADLSYGLHDHFNVPKSLPGHPHELGDDTQELGGFLDDLFNGFEGTDHY